MVASENTPPPPQKKTNLKANEVRYLSNSKNLKCKRVRTPSSTSYLDLTEGSSEDITVQQPLGHKAINRAHGWSPLERKEYGVSLICKTYRN